MDKQIPLVLTLWEGQQAELSHAACVPWMLRLNKPLSSRLNVSVEDETQPGTYRVLALPPETNDLILSQCGFLGRLLCTNLKKTVDASIDSLRLRPGAPRGVLLGLVTSCPALECLHCSLLECMDDDLLGEILAAGPGLRLVDVSKCMRLTATSHARGRALGVRFTFDQTAALKAVSAWQWLRKMGLKEPPDTKRNKAVVCARGCWRLWRPSDELDPAAVVELQLLALRDGSEEAIEACFSHSSPANRAATGPASRFGQMIRAGYPVMLSSNSVYVRQLKGEQLRRISSKPEGTVCVFVVGFASPNSPPLPPPGEDVSAWTSGTAEVFMWELSRNAAQVRSNAFAVPRDEGGANVFAAPRDDWDG